MKRLLLLAAMQSAILVGAQTSGGHLFYEDFATKNNFRSIGLLQTPTMT